MAVDEFQSVCAQADLLIVRNCSIDLWREEYSWPRRRVFIDSDPGFIQFRLANGDFHFVNTVNRCERLFTIGQRIGTKDCPIPTEGRHWVRTVPPVTLAHWSWADDGPATYFSAIMQWRSFQEVTYEGVTYGNKDREFGKFIDLPKLSGQPFIVALTGEPSQNLSVNGWKILPGWKVSLTPELYRTFIRESRTEFGVAKHGYVATQSGWLSDRSICYLASGRPVLVQDTGLGDWLPTGEGLLTFRDVPEALSGIKTINADYEQHRRAARLLAEEYFAADRVLPSLLESAME
jgi:hypothetical protein